MLLSDWKDLDEKQAIELESDQHAWLIQEKKDGVRVLVHIENGSLRITGRNISQKNFRLTEHQDNVAHLHSGIGLLDGTILDAELVCPASHVNTGSCTTESPLQATVALLATTPTNANQIQESQSAHLHLFVFDVLKHRGQSTTELPLSERLGLVEKSIAKTENDFISVVPSYLVNKSELHSNWLEAGKEGSVWKRADMPYEVGKRVKHWIKRKRELQVEAFVSGFKPGTEERSRNHLVGAVEFSIRNGNDEGIPIAWVSNWSDEDRESMTWTDPNGNPTLNRTWYGRKAVIVGQDIAGRSKRFRHARIKNWI